GDRRRTKARERAGEEEVINREAAGAAGMIAGLSLRKRSPSAAPGCFCSQITATAVIAESEIRGTSTGSVIPSLGIAAKRQAGLSKAEIVTCSTSYGENFVKTVLSIWCSADGWSVDPRPGLLFDAERCSTSPHIRFGRLRP
ncbi:MAG TPA: hypothetical protein VE687_03790, partial [Stellaceae bacterium]|nr:hypothetical protein [Stellaceae bacterium]